MSRGLTVAVLGAAGVNGDNLIQLLRNSSLPVAELHLLDSNAYLGRNVDAGGKLYPLSDYADFSYEDCDLALVCGSVPPSVIEQIRAQGCTLIADNAQLPDADTSLTLADINGDRQTFEKGMAIAVPPERASVLATLLSPLHDEYGVTSVDAVWLGSVAADGRKAIEGLAAETAQLLNGQTAKARAYEEKIAFNMLARRGDAEDDALVDLWRELWGDDLQVSLSSAVAPLFFGDMVSVTIELEQECDEAAICSVLEAVPSLEIGRRSDNVLLSSADAVGAERIEIGGVKRIDRQGRRYNFWIIVDGPRFGMAFNVIKIAEILAKKLFISYS